MAERRIFAGYYKRYDGKPIFVVRVLRDIDTGEAIVVCKDASFSREDNEHYYLIRYASFCEKVEVDGELLGETPLEFSILHKAIRIVVSKEFYDKRPETSCSCTVPEV